MIELMTEFKVEWEGLDAVRPYARNAKKHSEAQVEKIAKSITEFGWQQPIVVDKDGVIIIGHGRYAAARRLGLDKIPVVHADDLTKEQAKALRLVDNKVAESRWDLELLSTEIDSLDFDFEEFGFEEIELELDDGRRSSFHHNVFENQERQQFFTDNYFGIPIMQATQTTGLDFIRFCDWKEIKDPSGYIAHFYYDDYKFMSAWRNPEKYLDRLKKYKAVISPDFSLYTDFPRALQILSCYRRNWCGAFWAEKGIDVIPDVVWGDEQSYDYCFEGLPTGSVVAVSSVGVRRDKDWNGQNDELFVAGYREMLRRLKPTKILYYGDLIDGLEGDIIQIPSYYAEKRKLLNELKKRKDRRTLADG